MEIKNEVLSASTLAAFDADNFDETEAMTQEDWEGCLAKGISMTWVARTEQDEIAGICVLKAAPGVPTWYCMSIAIAPKYRGMRLGSRLYRAAIEGSVSSGLIQAHCAIDNKESIHLHEALSFKPIQYVPDFYGDNEDAIFWERPR